MLRSSFVACLCLAIVTAAAITAPAAPLVYDAANDYSTTNNPNGVWSYGYAPSLGGTFTLFPYNGDWTVPPLNLWYVIAPGIGPCAGKNMGSEPWVYPSAVFDAGQFNLAPGTPDLVVLRWTAPISGSFQIEALFEGMQRPDGTTTDVHVLLSGVSIYDAIVDGWVGRPYDPNPRSGPSPEQSFSGVVSLLAGETIDFAVGNMGNGQNCDGTGLSARITEMTSPIPEPAALIVWWLLGASGVTLGWWRRRKRAG